MELVIQLEAVIVPNKTEVWFVRSSRDTGDWKVEPLATRRLVHPRADQLGTPGPPFRLLPSSLLFSLVAPFTFFLFSTSTSLLLYF